MTKAVFYQSVGPELSRYDIDVDGAALTKRDAVSTPGVDTASRLLSAAPSTSMS